MVLSTNLPSRTRRAATYCLERITNRAMPTLPERSMASTSSA